MPTTKSEAKAQLFAQMYGAKVVDPCHEQRQGKRKNEGKKRGGIVALQFVTYSLIHPLTITQGFTLSCSHSHPHSLTHSLTHSRAP